MIDLKKFTILVVDDDPDLREIIFSIFEEEGFTVLLADNGKMAYEIFQANSLDLVVSDIRMPDGDGLTLLDQIRIHNSKVPIVIFVTGFTDISVENCLKRGALHVFPKPFNQKELMDSVKIALEIPL
ncbi:MAG: response regulator [Pseudobdellovibrio sp.]